MFSFLPENTFDNLDMLGSTGGAYIALPGPLFGLREGPIGRTERRNGIEGMERRERERKVLEVKWAGAKR